VARCNPAVRGSATESRRRRALPGVIVPLLIAVGVARIVSTYPVFSQTADEAAHVAAGMEWLERGRYRFETLHPPLARIAVALGPYLAGRRLGDSPHLLVEGNRILHEGGAYVRTLALARAGVLPFFVLACLAVWAWAKALFGPGAGLASLFLFVSLPPVLAHAGLATTDMALTATLALAVGTLWCWIEKPTTARALGLGGATGLTVLAKFTALLFLPVAAAALVLCRWLHASPPLALATGRGLRARQLGLALVVAAVVIWAGFRFSVGPAATPETRPHVNLDQVVGRSGWLHDASYRVVESAWLPMPEFFRGLRDARYTAQRGRLAYLLGEARWGGFWLFFPVALAVKTPLPFLVLATWGAAALARGGARRREFVGLAPTVAAVLVVVVCLPSRVNLGLRHVLPVYALLAPVAGWRTASLWASGAPLQRALCVGLLAWQAATGIAAHPDYLAYFNELAGSRPERVLLDSDLDWGQDLLRLEAALRERGVPALTLGYLGTADLARHGLPPVRLLEPDRPVTGWVAVSEYWLGVHRDRVAWLTALEPVAIVGRSIRLYYVAPPDEGAGPGSP
jgi:4-amino-4-deoxy-L-arabinose transferase-like glycosyltransferase